MAALIREEFAGCLRQMQREEEAESVKITASCLSEAKYRVGQTLATAAGMTYQKTGCRNFESNGDQFIAAFMGARREKGYPLLPGWFEGKAARISGEHRLAIAQAQRELLAQAPAPRQRYLSYGAGEE